MTVFLPPADYRRIRVVHSFDALVATPMADGVNAICWQRDLDGAFDELVRTLAPDADITLLDVAQLQTLPVSAGGQRAIDHLAADLERLRSIGHDPVLECVRAYERDPGALPTDVYSFHVDRADVATDTYLCTYSGPPSEGLRNDQARRCVDRPDVRARLQEQFDGPDDDTFTTFLAANCFDLHYAPLPGAQPFSFGVGNLWRLAVQQPDSRVPACIHRAPAPAADRLPRLLLIS